LNIGRFFFQDVFEEAAAYSFLNFRKTEGELKIHQPEFAEDGAEAIKKKVFFFVLSFLENFERPGLFFL